MPRSLITLAAAALVAGLASAGVHAAPAAAAPPEFFGVAPQAPLADRDFERMAKDNVGGIRAVFYWPGVEIAPGVYHWAEIDAFVARAAAAGARVLPVLYGTPEWAQSERRNRRCGVTCGPASAAGRNGFADFAAATVARYGPGGEFWASSSPPPPPEPEPPPPEPPPPCPLPLICPLKSETAAAPEPRRDTVPYRPIRAWQVWNEQNSPKYFGPGPNVRRYARLLKATAKRITSVDTGADVVVGGMWGPRGSKAVVPTERYLARLYRIRGVRRAVDSIAVHPYAGRLKRVKAQLRGIRRVARRAGDGRAGLWVSELGWASGGPRNQPLVKTRREQAALLRRSFRFLLRKRAAWNVRGVYWYSWRDTRGNVGICEWCPRSGLRAIGGAPKPAARAFRRIAAR